MPVTFVGKSEYDRNFRWVNGSLAATCGAPVAGLPSAALQSSAEPPIQRKSRGASPVRSSIVFEHPSSSDRRSFAQDDFLLLGRNEKLEPSQPYRNSQKKLAEGQPYRKSKKAMPTQGYNTYNSKKPGATQEYKKSQKTEYMQSYSNAKKYNEFQKKPKIKEAWSAVEAPKNQRRVKTSYHDLVLDSDDTFQVSDPLEKF